ncbi:MAG: nucleotidyl transferase AbiEii/AbiGii toxin family protein [Deltaproteobacteria bacterium]|nr:nucleotidyl transferase AbiEii/AbiGii toxin family protein [Deltaproteobacteria bacterium]
MKVEVDTNPPPGFDTETKYLLRPIAFSVRTVAVSDLFAGKMHAALCRRWKNRAKGRDWYDLVWFVTYHPILYLAHLEARMRQTGDWKKEKDSLTPAAFLRISREAIDRLDIEQARREVDPFDKYPETLTIWSAKFFHDLVSRIQFG